MKKIFKTKLLALIFVSIMILSCSKEPGEGGNSSINGSIWVKNYNSTFTVLNNEYEGTDQYVYLIYGDGLSYSDRVKTNYEGVFEFKYLRPGKYTLYVYSKDSTLQSPSGQIPVIKEVEITDKHEELEVPEFVIFN